MLGHTLFFWLGLIVPIAGGGAAFLVLRWRGISARRRDSAALLAAFWLLSVFMSVDDGRFDIRSFLVFFPVVTVWAIGIDQCVNWLDRARDRS